MAQTADALVDVRSDGKRHRRWKLSFSAKARATTASLSTLAAPPTEPLGLNTGWSSSSTSVHVSDDASIAQDCKQPQLDSRKSLRKSRSSPSIKLPSPSLLKPPVPRFVQVIPRSRSKPRPVISGPSLLPRRSSFASHVSATSTLSPVDIHSAGSQPASPISPGFRSQQCPSPREQACPWEASPDRRVRNRTESAPGLRMRPPKMGILSSMVKRTLPREEIQPSPTLSSFSSSTASSVASPAWPFTPRVPDIICPSPVPSISSIKRKPVPRFSLLYSEPPDHDPSAPVSPSLTAFSGITPLQTPHHTPLLRSADMIFNVHNTMANVLKDNKSLLPVGSRLCAGPRTLGHSRSFSERRYETDGESKYSPWPSTELTSAFRRPDVQKKVSSPQPGLTPPPHYARGLATRTRNVFSIESNPPLSSSKFQEPSREGALSPLTSDEINGIKMFLRRHRSDLGGRRGRRKIMSRSSFMNENRPWSDKDNEDDFECDEDENLKIDMDLESYEIHTAILESYHESQGEDEDGDCADSFLSRPSLSSSKRTLYEEVHDRHTEGAENDETDLETPVDDPPHRGTFGYVEDSKDQIRGLGFGHGQQMVRGFGGEPRVVEPEDGSRDRDLRRGGFMRSEFEDDEDEDEVSQVLESLRAEKEPEGLEEDGWFGEGEEDCDVTPPARQPHEPPLTFDFAPSPTHNLSGCCDKLLPIRTSTNQVRHRFPQSVDLGNDLFDGPLLMSESMPEMIIDDDEWDTPLRRNLIDTECCTNGGGDGIDHQDRFKAKQQAFPASFPVVPVLPIVDSSGAVGAAAVYHLNLGHHAYQGDCVDSHRTHPEINFTPADAYQDQADDDDIARMSTPFERLQFSLSKLKMHSPSIPPTSVFSENLESGSPALSRSSSGHLRCSPSLSRIQTRAPSPLARSVHAKSRSVFSKPKASSGVEGNSPRYVMFDASSFDGAEFLASVNKDVTEPSTPQGWRPPTPPLSSPPRPRPAPPLHTPPIQMPLSRDSCALESTNMASSFMHMSPKEGTEKEQEQPQQKSKTRMRLKKMLSGWPLIRRSSQVQKGEN